MLQQHLCVLCTERCDGTLLLMTRSGDVSKRFPGSLTVPDAGEVNKVVEHSTECLDGRSLDKSVGTAARRFWKVQMHHSCKIALLPLGGQGSPWARVLTEVKATEKAQAMMLPCEGGTHHVPTKTLDGLSLNSHLPQGKTGLLMRCQHCSRTRTARVRECGHGLCACLGRE